MQVYGHHLAAPHHSSSVGSCLFRLHSCRDQLVTDPTPDAKRECRGHRFLYTYHGYPSDIHRGLVWPSLVNQTVFFGLRACAHEQCRKIRFCSRKTTYHTFIMISSRIHVARLGSKSPGGVICCKSDVINEHKSCTFGRFGLSRICSLQLPVLAMKVSALFTAVLGTLILTSAGWCS